jgi:predicted RNase H-like HicB family nuclease
MITKNKSNIKKTQNSSHDPNMRLSYVELIAKALSHRFASDKTAPSVVFSQLKDQSWYASAVRFPKAFAKGERIVAFKSTGKTLDEALLGLAQQIANDEPKKNPVEELRALLSN